MLGGSTGPESGERILWAASWMDRAAPEGSPDAVVRSMLDRRTPLIRLASEAVDGLHGRFEQVTAMWPLLMPHHPDLLAARSHARLHRGLAENRAATEPLLDALGASRQRTGRPTCSALLLGLAAKNVSERTRAVDAVLDLAGRDLLDGPVLGDTLAALLTADVVVGSRVLPGLHEAARADSRAAAAVLDALVTALPALPGRRDAHLFVNLLAQLAVEQGRAVSLPEAFRQAAASTVRRSWRGPADVSHKPDRRGAPPNDTGALIAAGRGDRRIWALHRRMLEHGR